MSQKKPCSHFKKRDLFGGYACPTCEEKARIKEEARCVLKARHRECPVCTAYRLKPISAAKYTRTMARLGYIARREGNASLPTGAWVAVCDRCGSAFDPAREFVYLTHSREFR